MDYLPGAARRDLKLRLYWFVRQDLRIYQGLSLYQSRFVIPVELQNDIMERIHEGQQGIVKCRALTRGNVWWSGLFKQIAEKVGNCSVCEKERKYPLEALLLPDYPWQKVGMDLYELKGHTYLIIIDYYFRWIEVSLLQKTTSSTIVDTYKSVFSWNGILDIG